MKTYYIYLHRNKINNKVYIGQTCQKPEYRWNNGNGYLHSRKTKFKSSILKYGWDNIKHEVLFTNLDEDTASTRSFSSGISNSLEAI